jgi:hypothetical protein
MAAFRRCGSCFKSACKYREGDRVRQVESTGLESQMPSFMKVSNRLWYIRFRDWRLNSYSCAGESSATVIEPCGDSDSFAVNPNLFRIDLSMSCAPGGLGANNCLLDIIGIWLSINFFCCGRPWTILCVSIPTTDHWGTHPVFFIQR